MTAPPKYIYTVLVDHPDDKEIEYRVFTSLEEARTFNKDVGGTVWRVPVGGGVAEVAPPPPP